MKRNCSRPSVIEQTNAAIVTVKPDEVKKVFAERFKLLRQEKELGQIQLAKELDVGKSVISLWERGECEPTLSKLVAIAKFFHVTVDYLAGLEN